MAALTLTFLGAFPDPEELLGPGTAVELPMLPLGRCSEGGGPGSAAGERRCNER